MMNYNLWILLTLAGTSTCLPQGYLYPNPDVQLALPSRNEVRDSPPPGVHLPENCTFLTNTQTSAGQILEGEYSYKDPLGSTVTVQYSVGLDGQGYTEKRRFVMGKTNLSENDVTSELVEKIILELKPIIIRIIRATVQGSNQVELDSDNLVQTIIIKLRPVVLSAAEKSLETAPNSKVLPSDLTEQILVELTPFVQEGVRKEVETNQAVPTISVNVFIKRIIDDIHSIVTKIIRDVVTAAATEINNFEDLAGLILVRLKPIVIASVEKAISGIKFEEGNFTPDQVAEKILIELRPFVEEGVRREVKQQGSNGSQFSEQAIVTTVISQLREIVINIIRASVDQSGVDLTNYASLVDEIMIQLKPVVLGAVRKAIDGKTNLDAISLTEKILIQLEPFVEEGVRKEITLKGDFSETNLVANIIAQLKPTVIRIIQSTVSSSGVNLDNPEGLADTIYIQIRPVVLAAVNAAKSNNPDASGIDVNGITEKIVNQIRPFISEGVKEEIIQVQQPVPTQKVACSDEIVATVINQLKPTVIKIIRKVVASSGLEAEINNESLVESIMKQLEPVVSAAVNSAIENSGSNYDSSAITRSIIVQLRPFVEEGVRKEVAQSRKLSEEDVIQTITSDLRPTVITIISKTIAPGSNVNLNNPSGLVETIVVQLQPVVLKSVTAAIQDSASDIDPEGLSDRIIIELRPFIADAVQKQIVEIQEKSKIPKVSEDQVIKMVISQLKPTIFQVIRATVETAQVNLEKPDELVQTIINELQPVVLNAVENSLEPDSGLNSASLTKRILIEITPFIQEGVQQEISAYKLDQKSTQPDLIVQIIDQLRPVIIQTVKNAQINSNDQVLTPTTLGVTHVPDEDLTHQLVIKLTPPIEQTLSKVFVQGTDEEERVVGEVQYVEESENEELLATYNSGYKQQDEELTVSQVVDGLKSSAKSGTRAIVKESVLSSSDDDLADLVLNQLRSDIISAVKETDTADLDRIDSKVIARLRIFIIQEILLIRNEYQLNQSNQVPKSVSSIFGISGTNVVKVDTPTFNYGYQTDN